MDSALLRAAARRGDAHIVAALLWCAGMDPNDEDPVSGDSPLTLAAWAGFPGIVAMLLSAGSDPNHTDAGGMTALMHAAREGWCSVGCVLLRLAGNLDVNCGDDEGEQWAHAQGGRGRGVPSPPAVANGWCGVRGSSPH